MKICPENLKRTSFDGMSNSDHKIHPEAEAALKTGKYYASYPAWEFYGQVWYEGGKFYCQVKRYRQHIATVEGGSLQEIMDECCERWGRK